MIALGLLPLAAILVVFFALGGDDTQNLGRRFLDALLIWGAASYLLSEALSFLGILTPVGVTSSWILVILISSIVMLRNGGVPDLRVVFDALVTAFRSQNALLVGVCAIMGTILLVALVAPPNYFDAMTYHMARVANWVQNKSIVHYPTYVDRQLFMPPFAGFAILQFQVLSGGDRFANLVQWMSMLGSLVAVYLIAGKLGTNRPGQGLAVVFAATIPMGIIQASSAQTDLVLSMWLALLVYYLLDDLDAENPWNWVRVGVALGLAMLTKQTGYAIMLAFGLWHGIGKLRRNIKSGLQIGVVIGLIIASINFPHISRNLSWFGEPFSAPDARASAVVERFGVAESTSNVLKHSALHWGTIPPVDTLVEASVNRVHALLGVDPDDPALSRFPFDMPGSNADEARAGNPIHFAIGGLALIGVFLSNRVRRNKRVLIYALLLVLTFIFTTSVLKFTPFRSRLHLPWFVLLAPVFGLVAGEYLSINMAKILGIGFMMAALPWLAFNRLRPIVYLNGDRWFENPSILVASRSSHYFSHRRELEGPFRQAVDVIIRQEGCQNIGLVSSTEGAFEYSLWALLWETGIDFELTYSDGTFAGSEGSHSEEEPCAIVFIGGGTELLDPSMDAIIYDWEQAIVALPEG